MITKYRKFVLSVFLVGLLGCEEHFSNNPHSHDEHHNNVLHTSFSSPLKTLDPARSYSSNEWNFIAQIYEPPLQYHYLKRPYELEPLTASQMPKVRYINEKGEKVPKAQAKFSIYRISIRQGIEYQPHPAFARKENAKQTHSGKFDSLFDFEFTSTRELKAKDYVYQIKRLADPRLHSPVYGLLSKYIIGMQAYSEQISSAGKNADLERYDMSGVTTLDDHHYEIMIKGDYPQFMYWLAMPFFAPVPKEVDEFYQKPGMADNNITFDWYPVGTGAYYFIENNPNQRMILKKNPNYHADSYPSVGMPGDDEQGLLQLKGHGLPFTDEVVFSLEKESLPRWNKFLQGYYDYSAVQADSFDQSVQLAVGGEAKVSDEMAKKSIRLEVSQSPAVMYYGFNMLDPLVGGDSERARLLRQAISIAIDQEEYIQIFMSGRGSSAQGPIPIDIFGHDEEDFNPVVYDKENGNLKRKSIDVAKQLLAKAGYVDGMDPKTGKTLIINYDISVGAGSDSKAQLQWMRKQFQKIGLELNVRPTDYNRFQDKMETGDAQFFSWGWNADYPDPENFLFLLYGPNSRKLNGGENAANYHSARFDRLFNQMATMENSGERKAIIDKMLEIIRHDSPWVWGVHPVDYRLLHSWNQPTKPHALANNTLKYQSVDIALRDTMRARWNQKKKWPLVLFGLAIIVTSIPFVREHRRRERAKVRKES